MNMNYEFHFSEFKTQDLDKNIQQKAFASFQETLRHIPGHFLTEPFKEEYLKSCQEVYKKFSHKKHFCHVGLGGSSLGPEMLIDALAPANISCKFTFLNNIDSDDIHRKLFHLNKDETLFFIVSKSGGTIETAALFNIILGHLHKQGISPKNFKDYFVFATDPEDGDLRLLAKEYDIPTLVIPKNIGGRFSVLTPVGILPALFAGIHVHELLEGAQKMASSFLEKKEEQSLRQLLEMAHTIFELKNKYHISQTVLMPYSSLLSTFNRWFVQLWAESLGKEKTPQNFEGLTPIGAVGTTDQHSQLQLFLQGPKDKCFIFIHLKKFHQNYPFNEILTEKKELTSQLPLNEKTLNHLMKASFIGTKKALIHQKRPVIHLSIDKLTPTSLGELIIFFESLTVLMGDFLEINPFDQPGVELAKARAVNYLQQS